MSPWFGHTIQSYSFNLTVYGISSGQTAHLNLFLNHDKEGAQITFVSLFPQRPQPVNRKSVCLCTKQPIKEKKGKKRRAIEEVELDTQAEEKTRQRMR